ncbi:MAG: hypothetical protein DHS20C05_18790 [Hyphococcus sp.]|nr:MAG: hypothetical protein DHS20C05_18790 [Marinicaulis sp.]
MLHALNTLALIEESDTRHIASVLEHNADPLDQIVCKLGLVTEEKLAHAYSTLFSISVLDDCAIGDEADKLPEKVTNALNQEFLYSNRIVPIISTATAVTIAIVDPSMISAIQGVRFVTRPL